MREAGYKTMKNYILRLLKENSDFLSGEQLSQQLGVTRAAVWKAIKSLKQEGYSIEAVTNRGYRLNGASDVLSSAEIEECLKRQGVPGFVQQVFYEKTLDSTNQAAKRAAEKGAPDKSLFVAESQSAGRGRRGRTWISDPQQGLWFSLLLRPQKNPAEMARITLFAGLCVAEAIQDLGIQTGIKWPNDLLAIASHRKLCGILTEMIIEENQVGAVIIGIGVNINTLEFPPELASTATSLRLESGRVFSRTDVLAAILKVFAARYAGFLANDSWLAEYHKYCLTLGRKVQVVESDGKTFEGEAVDLDQDGELIIEGSDGQRRTVRSGEVSVRGLLGYV